MRKRKWERSTNVHPEHRGSCSFEMVNCGHCILPSIEQAKRVVMEIYDIWNGDTGASGGMKEPCTGNFHTNPIVNLSYLPGISLDTFAIAVVPTESCYVFMELLDDEDVVHSILGFRNPGD